MWHTQRFSGMYQMTQTSTLLYGNTNQLLLTCHTVMRFGQQDYVHQWMQIRSLFLILYKRAFYKGVLKMATYAQNLQDFSPMRNNMRCICNLKVPFWIQQPQAISRKLHSRWPRTVQFPRAQKFSEGGPEVLSLPSIYDGVHRWLAEEQTDHVRFYVHLQIGAQVGEERDEDYDGIWENSQNTHG